jgi:hypothetical protein
MQPEDAMYAPLGLEPELDQFDWYKRNLDRQLSAAGGVPPSDPQAVADPTPHPDEIAPPKPNPSPNPTSAQFTLEDRYGIKTRGPAADAATRAAEAYGSDVDAFEGVVTQGRPQQFGVAEPLGLDPGPL